MLRLLLRIRQAPFAQLVTAWRCLFPNLLDLVEIRPQAKEPSLIRDLLPLSHLKHVALDHQHTFLQ
jgi:hypothetical protein